MDVLSIEACVQAVIGAYRDASKLVQRLKSKQKVSEEFMLPEDLTKDFEDSLALGCSAVQSQYDHDVRRFGETYARGDAVAREQMKDILILLQQSVLSHLREVFMDEATLNLYGLKETSDDCRVNAIVCLGQLYQRMSTAASAMKQMARPTADEPDRVNLGNGLAYSSSRSTYSSFGARTFDRESATSYTTYGTRTATASQEGKTTGSVALRRRTSLVSATSYTSDRDVREAPRTLTPGEEGVPALPHQGQRSFSRASTDNASSAGLPSPGMLAPPPYRPDPSNTVQYGDQKGQYFPPHSSFYQPQAQSPTPASVNPDEELQSPTEDLRPAPLSLAQSPRSEPVFEMAEDSSPKEPKKPQLSDTQPVPLNPEYSTLEYVVSLSARSRPPTGIAETAPQQFQQAGPTHLHLSSEEQFSRPQTSPSYPPYGHSQERDLSPRPVSSGSDIHGPPPTVAPGPTAQYKALSTPAGRPLSIRSTASTSSRLSSFMMRKALPPGIAEVVQKPAPPPMEQPRYVRPQPLDLSKPTPKPGPTSPIARHMEAVSESQPPDSAHSHSPSSLEEKMRVQSPSLQISRSELNLPSESNLNGFCKGAVRHQLGGRKKGFGLESKRSLKGQEYFFKCTKCDFMGPASLSKALPSGGRGAVKTEKTIDATVRATPGGIKYRWSFLAKSHIMTKSAGFDGRYSNDLFGCYFCCAEGEAKGWVANGIHSQLATLGTFGEKKTAPNVTPVFVGLAAFLAHLETHREVKRRPGLIASNEMNCIVGRMAEDGEDFDLCLPPLV